jgi:hypothetical protein
LSPYDGVNSGYFCGGAGRQTESNPLLPVFFRSG